MAIVFRLALKLCGARRQRGAELGGGGAEEGTGPTLLAQVTMPLHRL
jgi:hypothetical protein